MSLFRITKRNYITSTPEQQLKMQQLPFVDDNDASAMDIPKERDQCTPTGSDINSLSITISNLKN